MVSEINQTKKEKYCMVSLMWNLKKKIKLIETDSRNFLPGTRGVGELRQVIKEYNKMFKL